MKKYEKIAQFSLVAILGIGLMISGWGCKGDTKAKTEPVVTKKIAAAPKAKPKANLPAKKGARSNSSKKPADSPPTEASTKMARLPFNPEGKLDPFTPLFKEEPKPQEGKSTKPKAPERPRTPLERLDLGQLKLTAIVFSQNRPRAMVEESTGKGYVIEIGTPIGLERGQVTNITRDRIVIELLQTDDFGNTAPTRHELKLQKPPGD